MCHAHLCSLRQRLIDVGLFAGVMVISGSPQEISCRYRLTMQKNRCLTVLPEICLCSCTSYTCFRFLPLTEIRQLVSCRCVNFFSSSAPTVICFLFSVDHVFILQTRNRFLPDRDLETGFLSRVKFRQFPSTPIFLLTESNRSTLLERSATNAHRRGAQRPSGPPAGVVQSGGHRADRIGRQLAAESSPARN